MRKILISFLLVFNSVALHAQTTIVFNGAESSGTTWTTSSNNFTSSTTNTGTPNGERIKSGSNSWQGINGTFTLVTNGASTSGYTSCFVEISNASISTTTGNGIDASDYLYVYLSNTASFGATPDVSIGTSSTNVRWGMSGTGTISTTAGTPVTQTYPTSGTITGSSAKSNIIINIPVSWTDVYVKIEGKNNATGEVWCIDDISLKGTAVAGCNLTSLGLSNLSCDDNATSGITSDDKITFDLNPTGTDLGATYSVSVGSGSVSPTTGTYGSNTSFVLNNGSAGGGDVAVTITDATTGTCTFLETITDPGSCSIAPCSEPSQATSLVLDNETSSSIDVSFTGSGADNYLVVQSTSSSLTPTNPLDGVTYSLSSPFGGGTVVYNGSGSSFTESGLLPTTTYYYFVFAYNDAACSGGPNYETPALTGNATTLTGPTCFAIQDFDGTNSWTYTSSPAENNATCLSNGDVWNIVSSLNNITIPNSAGNFWGVQDLNGASGCGTAGVGTLDFGTVNVSSFNDVTISFDFEVDGFNAATDEFSYIVTIDGNPQAEVFLCDGCNQQNVEGSETINIPNGSTTVSLQIRYSVDGGSDYSGVDNFAICGVLASPEPEINIQGNAIDIPDGNTLISLGDDTDFGDVLVSSGSNPNTFTIQNLGTVDLNITSVASSNATEFVVSGTTSGIIAAGDSATFTITFDPNATGTRTSTITIVSDDSDESTYTFDIAGNGTAVPTIVLNSADPAVIAGNILADSDIDNTVIYAFDLSVTIFDAELTAFDFTTSGTYAAGNITNFKAWYSLDNTFNSGSDTPLDNLTSGLGAGSHSFTGFSQVITSGSTGYIFITADLPCGATTSNTVIVNAITTANLTFTSGSKSGLAYAGGVQTITEVVPNNVTALATSNCENGGVGLSWTNAIGCSDNYIVVASLSSLVTAPSGNGIAYTANTVFGNGTAYDDGFVVYKGSATSLSVTGLTNGTNYTYTVFTRNGLSWSSGVAVDCTPNLIYCNAGPTSGSDSEIENVVLNGENNSISNNTTDACTGGTGGFINDFTALSADLNQGDSYTLSVEFGDCDNGGQFDGAAGVWIDWNGDGDFDDIDEEIETLDVAVSGGNVIHNFTINVALSQAIGNYRMRIVQEEGSNAASVSPCGTFSWGSVEDYTIEVIVGCIPSQSFTSMLPTSGPEGTEITITGAGFTASTSASFGSTTANLTFVDATTIIVVVPSGANTGAITLREAGCPIQTDIFTLITESGVCINASGTFTDLFISEVYDADVNNVWYVELYNPTAFPIDLAAGDYEIDRYADLTTTTVSSNADLTGVVPPYSVYLLSLGTSANTCSQTFDFTRSLSGINGEDRNVLTKGGVDIDVVEFPNQTGYSIRRLSSASGPTTSFNAADWDILLIEDCSDLGIAPLLSFSNPTVSSVMDASDCSLLDLSVGVTEGDASTTGDITYQWYFNDGVSSGWTAVSASAPAGFTILGEDGVNLLIEGDVNPLSSIDDYQFYCAVVEDGSCENVSNAIKFELQSERFYRSATSGSWGDIATWEVSDSPTGPWTSACEIPNDVNSDYISIFSGHTVNVPEGLGAPDVRADQLMVQSSATLILEANAELEIENGAIGSDFEIEGTFIDGASSGAGNGVTFNNGATWNIMDGATIVKTSSSSAATYRDNYEGGISTIPTNARWIYRYDGSGSVTIANSAGGSPMYYPDLIFESTSGDYDFNSLSEVFSGRLEPLTVKGDFTIGGNGNNVKVYNNNFNTTPIQVFGLLEIAAGSALTNEPYTTVNGNYDVQWREGSGFEFYNDLFIYGTLDLSHFAPNTASSSGRVEPGQEKVVLSKAAGTQFIYGGTSETFVTNDLDVNAEVQLESIDCVIEDELRFTSGIIITLINGPDLVVLNNPSTSAIINANTSGTDRYVEGKLKWTTDGSSSYTFPIGSSSAGGAQGFIIDLNGANGSEILGFLESNSTPPVQSFAYCDLETNPGGGTVNAGNGNAGFDGILDQIEFNLESFAQWNITNPNGGIIEYDLIVLADAGQDINPATTANGVEVRYLLKNGEPGNTGAIIGTGAPSFTSTGFLACPNQYSLTGMTSFSTFTLNGASQANTTLPVELLSFDARPLSNQQVLCSWVTVTEINNDFFTIERSEDGEVFQALGIVQGTGNSNTQLYYEFRDEEALSGVSYYRLQQTDFDGTSTYSRIVAVGFDQLQGSNVVYPSPFETDLILSNDTDTKVDYLIYDINAKLILKGTFNGNVRLDLSELAKGAYFVKLSSEASSEVIKVLKK